MVLFFNGHASFSLLLFSPLFSLFSSNVFLLHPLLSLSVSTVNAVSLSASILNTAAQNLNQEEEPEESSDADAADAEAESSDSGGEEACNCLQCVVKERFPTESYNFAANTDRSSGLNVEALRSLPQMKCALADLSELPKDYEGDASQQRQAMQNQKNPEDMCVFRSGFTVTQIPSQGTAVSPSFLQQKTGIEIGQQEQLQQQQQLQQNQKQQFPPMLGQLFDTMDAAIQGNVQKAWANDKINVDQNGVPASGENASQFMNYLRFCFFECKPADGFSSPSNSQCMAVDNADRQFLLQKGTPDPAELMLRDFFRQKEMAERLEREKKREKERLEKTTTMTAWSSEKEVKKVVKNEKAVKMQETDAGIAREIENEAREAEDIAEKTGIVLVILENSLRCRTRRAKPRTSRRKQVLCW